MGCPFAEKMSVVKWAESSKLCLDFLGAGKLTKSLHSHTQSFGENLSVKGERKNNFAALVDKLAPKCPL